MKKITISFLCTIMGIGAFAQGKTFSKVIDVGVIGQMRSTWLINQNVSDASGHMDYESTFGGGAGLRVQYFGAGALGGGFEIGYGTINQKYKAVDANTTLGDYESKTKISALDIPVFLKLGSSEGGYFEFGCQFSFITGAEHETSVTTSVVRDQYSGDVSNLYESMYIAPFIGFGGSFNLMNETLMLTAGLRFAYGVTDIGGVDGLGQDLAEGNPKTYNNVLNQYDYDEYKSTNPIYGALMLGLVYSIAVE